MYGTYRDWEAIRAWSRELVPLLATAKLMHTDGIRLRHSLLRRQRGPRLDLLDACKRKIGKRIFFTTDAVAAVIACKDSAIARMLPEGGNDEQS